MFRALGILVVAIIVLVVIAYIVRVKAVRPALRRRHIAELEAENERLDRLVQPKQEARIR